MITCLFANASLSPNTLLSLATIGIGEAVFIKLLEYYKTLDPEDAVIANALWERLFPAPLTVSRKESLLASGTFGVRLYQVNIPWQANTNHIFIR